VLVDARAKARDALAVLKSNNLDPEILGQMLQALTSPALS
jgi:hypothetical protein